MYESSRVISPASAFHLESAEWLLSMTNLQFICLLSRLPRQANTSFSSLTACWLRVDFCVTLAYENALAISADRLQAVDLYLEVVRLTQQHEQ